MPAQRGLSSATIDFWLQEAETLKETAELCWSTERRALEQETGGFTPAQRRLVEEASVALGEELELLYRYLIAMAIQYLAIGLLIARDPYRFLHKPPGHTILGLLEECGFTATAVQRRLLLEVENAFAWGERYPVVTKGRNSDDSLVALAGRLAGLAPVGEGEKGELDALYAGLLAEAKRLVAGTLGP